jgi:hypothetical protein
MKCLDKRVDEIIAKYYPNNQNKLNELEPVNLENERMLGSYLIGLKSEYNNLSDHNAFREVINVLDGTVENYFEFINCYEVNFKNDRLDMKNLNKLISIKYIEPNGIVRMI